jgi:hypothetical protein
VCLAIYDKVWTQQHRVSVTFTITRPIKTEIEIYKNEINVLNVNYETEGYNERWLQHMHIMQANITGRGTETAGVNKF